MEGSGNMGWCMKQYFPPVYCSRAVWSAASGRRRVELEWLRQKGCRELLRCIEICNFTEIEPAFQRFTSDPVLIAFGRFSSHRACWNSGWNFSSLSRNPPYGPGKPTSREKTAQKPWRHASRHICFKADGIYDLFDFPSRETSRNSILAPTSPPFSGPCDNLLCYF